MRPGQASCSGINTGGHRQWIQTDPYVCRDGCFPSFFLFGPISTFVILNSVGLIGYSLFHGCMSFQDGTVMYRCICILFSLG